MSDVSRLSGNRWSASVIGYYERGKRTITVSTLCELAGFYGVRSAYLLGEEDDARAASGRETAAGTIVLHRPTLSSVKRAEPVDRFARWIASARAAADGEWLAVRSADLRVMAVALEMDPVDAVAALRKWGCHVSEPAATNGVAISGLSMSAV